MQLERQGLASLCIFVPEARPHNRGARAHREKSGRQASNPPCTARPAHTMQYCTPSTCRAGPAPSSGTTCWPGWTCCLHQACTLTSSLLPQPGALLLTHHAVLQAQHAGEVPPRPLAPRVGQAAQGHEEGHDGAHDGADELVLCGGGGG